MGPRTEQEPKDYGRNLGSIVDLGSLLGLSAGWRWWGTAIVLASWSKGWMARFPKSPGLE